MLKNWSLHLIVVLISAISTGEVCVFGQVKLMTEEEISKELQNSTPIKGEIYCNGNAIGSFGSKSGGTLGFPTSFANPSETDKWVRIDNNNPTFIVKFSEGNDPKRILLTEPEVNAIGVGGFKILKSLIWKSNAEKASYSLSFNQPLMSGKYEFAVQVGKLIVFTQCGFVIEERLPQQPDTTKSTNADTGSFTIKGVLLNKDGTPIKRREVYIFHVQDGRAYAALKSGGCYQDPSGKSNVRGQFTIKFGLDFINQFESKEYTVGLCDDTEGKKGELMPMCKDDKMVAFGLDVFDKKTKIFDVGKLIFDNEKLAGERPQPIPQKANQPMQPEQKFIPEKPDQPMQPIENFIPEATVVFVDGSSLALSEFALYESPFGAGVKTSGSGRESFPEILLLEKDDFWKTVQFSEVQKLECSPERESYDWLITRITLISRINITGKIPVDLGRTWIGGGQFEFQGKRAILSSEGIFNIVISKVKSLVRNADKPDSYEIIDVEGKTYTVRDLKFGYSWTGSVPVLREGKSTLKHKIYVDVENMEGVPIAMNNIESFVFPSNTNDSIKIKLKNGEESDIKFNRLYNEIGYVFGKTEFGQIFFKEIVKDGKYVLRSILFK